MKDFPVLEPAVVRGTSLSEDGRLLAIVPGQPSPAVPPVAPLAPSPQALAELHAAELAALFSEARERGYREGRETAEQECAVSLQRAEDELQARCDQRLEELRVSTSRLSKLAQALESERKALHIEMEASMLELTLAALCKILGDKTTSGMLMPELVKNALHDMDRTRSLRVRLSPADHAGLLALDTTEAADLAGHAELIADPALADCSCVIENSRGALDASLDVQLRAFKELLVTTYRQRRETDG